MEQCESLHYKKGYQAKHGNGGKYDLVKLAYTDSSISLILAIDNYSIRNKQLLKQKDLQSIEWKFNKLRLFVPKFKFEMEMKMKEILKSMGIKQAFDNCADFSKMTGDLSLLIDTVIH